MNSNSIRYTLKIIYFFKKLWQFVQFTESLCVKVETVTKCTFYFLREFNTYIFKSHMNIKRLNINV